MHNKQTIYILMTKNNLIPNDCYSLFTHSSIFGHMLKKAKKLAFPPMCNNKGLYFMPTKVETGVLYTFITRVWNVFVSVFVMSNETCHYPSSSLLFADVLFILGPHIIMQSSHAINTSSLVCRRRKYLWQISNHPSDRCI